MSMKLDLVGSSAPLGFFDPLGFTKGADAKTITKYRESGNNYVLDLFSDLGNSHILNLSDRSNISNLNYLINVMELENSGCIDTNGISGFN